MRKVRVSLERGAAHRQADLTCAGTTRKQPVRVNIPAGEPVTVSIAKESEDLMGLIAWELRTLDPTNVQGCADDIVGC
nr:hypothetical protein OG409_09390 [Streptomyces sp. NBC_00974]